MDIKVITVIGAGIMGRGIAHVAALGGFRTILNDISPELLESARSRIQSDMEKGVERGKLNANAMTAALALLSQTTDLADAASRADLLIEAIPENIDLKIDIFSRLGEMAPKHAILASNTSGLSVTEMAAPSGRPGKFIGMHFFNPVHKMKLVEIIRGLETDDVTFETVQSVAVRMGKETVEINESPGFVTSRINALIGNEAFYMLEAGVGSARDIDKALKLGLNHPMGPFEMIDLVGLDTRLSILRFLHQTLGEKYRPCPLLVKYVKAGRLGRKVGKGVYEYSQDTSAHAD